MESGLVNIFRSLLEAQERDPVLFNRRLNLIFVGVLVPLTALILLIGWPRSAGGAPAPESAVPRAEPIKPIPLTVDLDPQEVELGRRLFFDKRLSRTQTVSCASCHMFERGGTDGRPRSIGIDGSMGDINSPTVFNAVYNFRQFWDGRAATLEEQVNGPIHDPKEMGFDWEQVVGRLKEDEDYPRRFRLVYRQDVAPELVRRAIAAFERSLVTPNARFDRWLRGDKDALTETELQGYALFKSRGCITCHQGMNVGGNMYQTFGVMGGYFLERGNPTRADLGRFNVTGLEEDRHKFKVPSLRNVELTAPYFHDGSASTLEEAVGVMGRYQLGIILDEDEIKKLAAFLRTLTGEYGGRSLAKYQETPDAANDSKDAGTKDADADKRGAAQ